LENLISFPLPVVGEVYVMKEYECVQVRHHKDVAATIEEWQEKGWQLHTYNAAGESSAVNHYLLFERGA
jgi:hypothetical protein